MDGSVTASGLIRFILRQLILALSECLPRIANLDRNTSIALVCRRFNLDATRLIPEGWVHFRLQLCCCSRK